MRRAIGAVAILLAMWAAAHAQDNRGGALRPDRAEPPFGVGGMTEDLFRAHAICEENQAVGEPTVNPYGAVDRRPVSSIPAWRPGYEVCAEVERRYEAALPPPVDTGAADRAFLMQFVGPLPPPVVVPTVPQSAGAYP